MPTIAEILAAKKAGATATAAAGKPATYAAAAPKETLAQRAAAAEAIDRIDPPGKPAAAAAARKMTGLILNKDMPCAPKGEPRGQATPIRTLAEPTSTPLPLANHHAWGAVLGCNEDDLCLMRDSQDPETAWLAVRHKECDHPPIMIIRLPWLLWEHPAADRPDSEPF